MAKNKTSRAKDVASTVGSNPYLRRLVEDAELRENLREAYLAGMAAYGRMQRKKAPAKALMDDKKVHKELKEATESLREATDRLRGKAKRRRRWPKVLVAAVAAGGVALAVSEDLRKKLLDTVFGAEEEFEYTSTTSPAPNDDAEAAGEQADESAKDGDGK